MGWGGGGLSPLLPPSGSATGLPIEVFYRKFLPIVILLFRNSFFLFYNELPIVFFFLRSEFHMHSLCKNKVAENHLKIKFL